MKKASVLGLLIAILFCSLQPSSGDARQDNKQDNKDANSFSCPHNITEDITTPKILGKIALTAFWVFLVIAAVLCNVLIIHVIRVNPHMRTTTNYYIVNMAFGDTLATITTTFGSLYVLYNGYEWSGNEILGEYIFCTLGCQSYHFFMLCSLYSLVAITFDRFLAVTRPLKYKGYSSCTKYIIPLIWIVSIAVPAHYIITKQVFCRIEGKFFCVTMSSQVDIILILVLGFGISHIICVVLYMAIAYKLCTRIVPGEHATETNGQTTAHNVARKVTRMIIWILVAFEISWTPIFIGYVLPVLVGGSASAYKFTKFFWLKMLMISNGISNCIIYITFNENFRRAFKEILPCKSLLKIGNIQIKFQSKDQTSSTVGQPK